MNRRGRGSNAVTQRIEAASAQFRQNRAQGQGLLAAVAGAARAGAANSVSY